MSEQAISLYFSDRETIKKSLERMMNINTFELHIASAQLQIVIDNDPTKITGIISLLVSIFALFLSFVNASDYFVTIVIIPVMIIIIGTIGVFFAINFISAKTVDTIRLKTFIDKAIELQKENN